RDHGLRHAWLLRPSGLWRNGRAACPGADRTVDCRSGYRSGIAHATATGAARTRVRVRYAETAAQQELHHLRRPPSPVRDVECIRDARAFIATGGALLPV